MKRLLASARVVINKRKVKCMYGAEPGIEDRAYWFEMVNEIDYLRVNVTNKTLNKSIVKEKITI